MLLVHFLIPINYLPDFEAPYLSTSYCSACIWHPGTIFPLGQMNPVFFLKTRRRWFSCFLWPFPSPTTGSSPLMASLHRSQRPVVCSQGPPTSISIWQSEAFWPGMRERALGQARPSASPVTKSSHTTSLLSSTRLLTGFESLRVS